VQEPAVALEGSAPDPPRERIEATGAEEGGEFLDEEHQPEWILPLPDADPRQQHQQVARQRARHAEFLDEHHLADREQGVARQQFPHPPRQRGPEIVHPHPLRGRFVGDRCRRPELSHRDGAHGRRDVSRV